MTSQLLPMIEELKKFQTNCTHRKWWSENGKLPYTTISHQLLDGKVWVRCLRCAKTWKDAKTYPVTEEEMIELILKSQDEIAGPVIESISKQPETPIAALETERRIKEIA